MLESSDRPQEVKQPSSSSQKTCAGTAPGQQPQPHASVDNSDTSLISSSSSCSRRNSSTNNKEEQPPPPPATPTPSANQTTTTSASSKTDDTTTSSFSPQDQANQRTFLAIVQTQLAWQLAYYFSPANLAVDTYLKTLQGLNDGCVPVNILANFGKIQTILSVTPCLRRVYHQGEAARVKVLVQAVLLNPDCGLQVVNVDARTGKVVDIVGDDQLKDENAAATAANSNNIRTLLAIRSVPSTEAAAAASAGATAATATTPSSSDNSSSSFTNCVLLRDANPTVTEVDVRELLERLQQQQQEEDSSFCCPPVLRIQCDAAHCWLISFDTTDRDTLLQVVLQLRTLTLKGDYVHARLKSSSSSSSSSSPSARSTHLAAAPSTLPPVDRAAAVAAAAMQLGIPLQKRKNRRRGKKKKKASNSDMIADTAVTDNKNEEETQQLPPSLEEFPMLYDNTVEWTAPLVDVDEREAKARNGHDHDDDEEEPSSKSSNKGHSDAASTATTTSSSMDSVPKKTLAGYAAAVLKNNSSNPVSAVGTIVQNQQEYGSSAPQAPAQVDTTKSGTDSSSSDVVIQPPTWGRGRSFADAAKASS